MASSRTLPVSLSAAIKQYISTKYDQHPDTFTRDLEVIDDLRKNAVTSFEPHPSGIRKIQAYAAQLVWMGSKFPIDLGVDFTWYPSLGYNTETAVSQNNIRFELANILFNLAVLYCQLAVSANRSTSEGLKLACNYFCLSAGVISHLKSSVIPEMRSTAPEDMDSMTLECIEQLLLAQAQECFWQKAVKDGLKDSSIAKLAAKVSDLYAQAADFAVQSEAIRSEWIHHMQAKHHHLAAAAQFRAACDCLEKRKYGEEVGRLQESLACANEALKESRYLNKIVLGDLNGLKNKVQDDLRRAEKDNDMIYLQPVPPRSELKAIDRASLASAKIPKEVSDPVSLLGDHSELGRPLFTKLVPYSVHLAGTVYASRRDQVIDSIVEELEGLTARIHSLLKSLNLPGSLQALEKPLGLPPGLTSHAEEIRQQRGMERLRRSMEDVDKLKTNDRAAYEEAVEFLRSEAEDDNQARAKYGTDRWNRQSSQDAATSLLTQMTEIDGYLKSADASDHNVRDKVRENEDLIRLLAGIDRDLEDVVPSSKRVVMTPQMDREVNSLRGTLNDITRLETRRRRKVESLRLKAQADDVTPDLHREAARLERAAPLQPIEAADFEDLFDQRLRRYDPDHATLTAEHQEQTTLLAALTTASTAFTTARRGDTTTLAREQALQKLENAYFAYKEVVQNLDVGRKFYNDLAPLVASFRDDCRAFAYRRRAEAEALEADILTELPMARMRLGPSAAATSQAEGQQRQQQQPAFQQQQQQQRTRVEQRQPYSGRSAGTPTTEPLAAPVPVKPRVQTLASGGEGRDGNVGGSAGVVSEVAPSAGMWTPEMGIRFGGGGGGGAAAGAAAGGGNGSVRDGRDRREGRWEPSRGLKFG